MMQARNYFSTFVRDRRGNIALLFGLLLFVILGGAGIGIDISRATMVRTEIHEAADAALLAAARYKNSRPNADMDELTNVARKVFDNGIKNKSIMQVDSFAVSFDPINDTFALDVGGSIDTLIMAVLGQKYVAIDTRSEAKLGKTPLLEVAMVLDTTGSMNQKGKISTMRNAARDLVKTLFEADGADVKIGVVPFAQYVNVGKANAAKSWLNNPGAAWMGCVGSRDYPFNVKDSNYDALKVPGLNGIACPNELMPLSTNDEMLDTMIGKLNPNGFTYIPAGLAWGWRLLTPNEPFSEGVSFATLEEQRGTKALILMTDGENTKAPDYPTHASPDQILANNLTKEICGNIKVDDIVIYTIAFDVSDFTIKDILQSCATTPSHYFDAASADDLIDAFASIASSLRNISLSK